jgi:SAM-dependent methyltransferase
MADPGDLLRETLRLLADETRLRVLHLLEREPLTVAELQEVLNLGQSSISGHLAKLKSAGLIHDIAEGSARRYRLREDIEGKAKAAWAAVRDLSKDDPHLDQDRRRLDEVLAAQGTAWVDRVAGSLHREYAPGRTWESLCPGLLTFARFGRCVDVGAGDGSLVELIAPRALTLDSVDASAAMVSAGRAKVSHLGLANVRYHQARAEALPLPDASADSVLFLQSLQYIPDPAPALAEAKRVLVPGGRLLVLTLARHDFAEADRYGHRHRGFLEKDLRSWCREFSGLQLDALPPESRPPRFQTVVVTGLKT